MFVIAQCFRCPISVLVITVQEVLTRVQGSESYVYIE